MFVTTTAWVFILLGALASLCTLVQQADLASWSLNGGIAGVVPSLPPAIAQLSRGVMAIGLVLSLATLACAIGLLMRLEWARRAFIGLLVLALAANLLGLWLQHELLRSVVEATLGRTALPDAVAGVVGGFVTAARVMAAVVTLGGCMLLAWIIQRLRSPAVRQEFG